MFGNRLPGVVNSTATALPERVSGPPRSVASIVKMEHFLVTFCDDMGDQHVDILLKLGDRYLASPFGEEWCGKLGPAMGWLEKEVAKRVAAKEGGVPPEAIPSKDAVNVTGNRIAQETQKLTGQK